MNKMQSMYCLRVKMYGRSTFGKGISRGASGSAKTINPPVQRTSSAGDLTVAIYFLKNLKHRSRAACLGAGATIKIQDDMGILLSPFLLWHQKLRES